jgi:RHS repeat-associated protein
MPVWRVSEPAISLWLNDEPLGYQPAAGPRISLQLGFKQREVSAGMLPNIFSVGKKWNFSWLSYVSPDANGVSVLHFQNGREATYYTTNDYLSNTRLTGNANSGYMLSNPDGSKNVYGFIVTNSFGVFQQAFLTEQWNANGQKTTFTYFPYSPASPVVRLQFVVDGDGRTNSLYYVASNAYSTNLINQIVDAFGRTNSYAYDSNGYVTNLTDVINLSTSFAYDAHGWVTNMITPYGTNIFVFTDSTDPTPNGRSVLVTQPDGGHQLWLYRNSAPGVASSYATNLVPITAPLLNTFDNSQLNLRNTFYWGPRQYTHLSTTSLGSFGASDFKLARMKHWLIANNFGADEISYTLSLEREPSPDNAGGIEGQMTWYDYAGKTTPQYEGTQSEPLFVARVLPDGSSSFTHTDRNSFGAVLTNISTYSSSGGVVLRTNIFTYDANGVDLLTSTDASTVRISSNSYNGFHEVLTNFNALNEMTVYTYNSVEQVTSITRPSGLVTTNIYATNNLLTTTFEYATTGGGTTYYRTNSYAYTNDLVYTHTDERGLTTINTWDNLQRLLRTDFADGTYITNTYSKLDFVKLVDRLGFPATFGYDSMRRKIAETNALGNYTLYNYCTCGTLDSIQDPGGNLTTYTHDNANRLTQTQYADGYIVNYNLNLLGQITNTSDSAGTSITNWFNNQGLQYAVSNAFGQVSSTSFDILDRPTNTVDANGVSINSTFDALGRILTRAYPDNGVERFGYTLNISPATGYTNQLTNVTKYGFDPLSRKTAETNANQEITRYSYNGAGDLLTLTDGNTNITTWIYDQYGRVTNKFDAANNLLFIYKYDADGRLTNRWSAAKGNTTYSFDAVGNLTGVSYPVSPSIALAYDVLNRLTNMVDAAGTTHYGYDAVGQVLSEDGPWNDDTVTYTYTNRLRATLSLQAPNASPWAQRYGYDPARRLRSITSPVGEFDYAFDALRSTLPARLILPNGAFITNSYDGNARMLSTLLENSTNGILDSWTYVYNPGSQRTNATRTDGSFVSYSYDNAGQLSGALGKEWGGVTNRLNEQFGYSYDGAGNLNWRTNNALLQGFSVNNLNELTTESNSGTLTVAGTTTSLATNVTVNGLSAALYRDATFATNGFTLANGTNSFTAIARDALGRIDTNTVTAYLPTTNSFSYDVNGNLLSDGQRAFDYDDENQLIRITVSNSWKSEFVYDGKMRRRMRFESTWNGTKWITNTVVRYVYDGSLVLQERDSNNLPLVSYTRGNDLSGSLQGAGGIGGLLARTDHHLLVISDPGAHAFYHADGSGNVTVLMSTAQTLVAKYLYDPFGNIISQSGPVADANIYRFSSKEVASGSGLIYYLYRFYEPDLQRWLNRDPIEEKGGMNLYGFVKNSPLIKTDYFGLANTPGGPWGPPVYPDPKPAPPIDCSGYASLGGKTCKTCFGFGTRKDTYPEKAYTVCEGFKQKYTGTIEQGPAACVAKCLIAAEQKCQAFYLCSDRNCCRLAAHVLCYAGCGFIPFAGLPPGGAAVGAGDLLPSCLSGGAY